MLVNNVEDVDQAGLFKSEMTTQRAFDTDNQKAILKECGGVAGLLKRGMNGGYSSGDCSNFTSSPAKSSSPDASQYSQESQPSAPEQDSEKSHPSQKSEEGEVRVSADKAGTRLAETADATPTDLESSMTVEHSADEYMDDIFATGAIFGQSTAAGDMMDT